MNNPEVEIAHPTALDGDQQQIGALYGKAILGAAGENADNIIGQLKAIVDECLNAYPALEAVLASPRVRLEDKEGVIDRIFSGKVDSTLLNFLKVLCRRGRIGSLRAIQVTAAQLRDEQLGKVQVMVTSAQPLSDDQRTSIANSVGASLGKEVVLEEKVDAALLGGIIVRIGDRVYDGSALGKLSSIRTAVTGGIQKAIRDQYESLLSS